MPDWTVPVDDLLVERWQCCSVCGREAGRTMRVQVWTGTVTILQLQCVRCQALDPTGVVLTGLMAHRYGKESP
jgi:hypothetical protein